MATSWIPGTSGGEKRGLFANLPRRVPDEGGKLTKGNCLLSNANQEMIGLWVDEVTADFNMAGTVAQSKGLRHFYAHNLTQPRLTISGQMPNTLQFNRLAEFVRQHHKSFLLNDNSLRLFIPGGGWKPTNNKARKNIRGHHEGIDISGYVEHVQKGAERWINAPTFSFDFVIVEARRLLTLQDERIDRIVYKDFIKLITHYWEASQFEKGKPADSNSTAGEGQVVNPPDPATEPTPYGGGPHTGS